jgi:hypothetical protein
MIFIPAGLVTFHVILNPVQGRRWRPPSLDLGEGNNHKVGNRWAAHPFGDAPLFGHAQDYLHTSNFLAPLGPLGRQGITSSPSRSAGDPRGR